MEHAPIVALTWKGDNMKKAEWVTPNRMLFESGHKTFDRKADLISTGNVWGSVQTSGYVRAYSETECNGLTSAPGHLRDFDLKGFMGMPSHVRRYVLSVSQDKSVIVYKFFHCVGNRKTVHGWVVTSTNPEYRLLNSFVTGPTWKSESVISEAIKYITEGD